MRYNQTELGFMYARVQLFCENVHISTYAKQKRAQCIPVPSSVVGPGLPPKWNKYIDQQFISQTIIYRKCLKGI